MSIWFFYEPLPTVHFRRRQEVSFFIGDPVLTFRVGGSEPSGGEKKVRQIHERREHREFREPKSEPSRIPELFMSGKSLFDCDLLLQKLMSERALKGLCNLVGTQIDNTFRFSEQYPGVSDLSGIRRKIQKCEYENATEVRHALIEFFKAVDDVFNGQDRGRAARRFRTAVSNAFDSVDVDTGYAHLKSQLGKMTNLEVGEIGRELEQQEDSLVKLTARLNALTPREKLRAEWIIRQQFPTLPHYEEGIDVRMLPGSVINELVSRFKTLRVEVEGSV